MIAACVGRVIHPPRRETDNVAGRIETSPDLGFTAPIMTTQPSARTTLTGILLALGGSATLSINDLAIKFLSGSYALHQVILIRAAIGMVFLLGLMHFSGTGFRQIITVRGRDHLIRVAFVLCSNLCYFLGLAALPLADAVAIASADIDGAAGGVTRPGQSCDWPAQGHLVGDGGEPA